MPIFASIYADPQSHWAAYETCEELVDLEDNFQLWRFRHLKTVERPEVVQAIEDARAHGDLSENAEYHAAKERQGQIEAMIADIDDQLSRAMVIDPSTLSGTKVVFGATVHLIDENDKKIVYQIVGETEADARVGRISYNSPLGRALIGRSVGDEVEFSAPSGDRYFEIAAIEFK